MKTTTISTTLRHIVLAASVALGGAALTTPAVAGPLDWVGGERIQGNGVIKKQSRELPHFTGVSFSLPGNVELRIGNSENITIETDDNLLPQIETVVEKGVLQIRPAKRNMSLNSRHMKIWLNAQTVESLSLGGSGSIDSDALRAKKLQVTLGGSGSISVKGMEAETVSVGLGGSGNFKSGTGNAVSMSVNIGGSGDVDVGQVRSREASVSVAGSGEATVWATSELSVTIAGSGDVNYYGDPKVSRSVIGSGSTRRLGSAAR